MKEQSGLSWELAYKMAGKAKGLNDRLYKTDTLWSDGIVIVWSCDPWFIADEVKEGEPADKLAIEFNKVLEDIVPASLVQIAKVDKNAVYLRFVGIFGDYCHDMAVDAQLFRALCRKSKGPISWKKKNKETIEFYMSTFASLDMLVVYQNGDPKFAISQMARGVLDGFDSSLPDVLLVSYDPDAKPASPEELQALQELSKAQQATRAEALRAHLEKLAAKPNPHPQSLANLRTIGKWNHDHLLEFFGIDSNPQPRDVFHSEHKPVEHKKPLIEDVQDINKTLSTTPTATDAPKPAPTKALVASPKKKHKVKGDALPFPSVTSMLQASYGTLYTFTKGQNGEIKIAPYFGDVIWEYPDGEVSDFGKHPEAYYMMGCDYDGDGCFEIGDLTLVIRDLKKLGWQCASITKGLNKRKLMNVFSLKV